MIPIEQQITVALADLGDSSDVIAATLLRQGIMGIRKTFESCPIACYLTRKFGGPGKKIAVGHHTASIRPVLYDIERSTTQCVNLSEPIEQFIRDFDAGAFPFLQA